MTSRAPELAWALSDRYTIERELGAGGMATVYLAHDVKHDRKVALKVLKPELAAVVGADRFLAEIRTTANLQHPHILPLFDSGEADGFLYFVMPYVEGESLRDRLDREGELPIDEAVNIANAVASALDYAHRHGVIHRDIKPANILLHDGQPLVADFGIALAVSAAGGGRLTETGLSLGTPYYMSPEQAVGDRVLDARSDVYSLGCVLYEMLTGEPPFSGGSAQAVLSRILTADPVRPTAIRRAIPAHVEAAVLRALERRPADRFTDAAQLADAVTGRIPLRVAPDRTTARTQRRTQLAMIGMALVTIASLSWGVRATWFNPGPAPDSARWDIVLPDAAPLALAGPGLFGIWKTALAVSPDGRTLAWVAPAGETTRLWVRPAGDSARALPSTDGGYFPVFSPDGQWIAYVTGGRLMKISASGGAPVPLHENVGFVEGMAWSGDGRILLTLGVGLGWVPASGGVIEPFAITPAMPLTRFGDFSALPGEEWVLGSMMVTGQIAVLSLETGSLLAVTLDGTVPVDSVDWTRALVGAAPRYASGYITYLSNGDGVLMAAPFDVRSRRLIGQPFPVLDDVRRESPLRYGQYAISANGTLFYAPGRNEEYGRLAIANRNGAVDTLDFPRAQYHGVRLAPDGSRIAAFEWPETVAGAVMKVMDLRSGGIERLPLEPGYHYATGDWTPGGDTLAIKRYSAVTSQGLGFLFYRPSDRTVLDVTREQNIGFMSFLPDGSGYVWDTLGALINFTSLATQQTTTGPALGWSPSVSRAGNAIAFIGQDGPLGVTRFPPEPNWTPVVVDGSPNQPEWGPGGKLIYRDIRTFKEIDVTITASAIEGSLPRIIARGPFTHVFHTSYDVTADDRLLVVLGSGDMAAPRLRVITRFDREIARLDPANTSSASR